MAKILVVEDEADLADSLRDWLILEGHRVEVSNDGKQALEMLSQSEYDVIVLDLMLPGIDGLQVCRQYRTSGGGSRILMLTAKTTVNDKEEGLDCGADDYIGKPYDLKEVSARVRALMRRSISVVGTSLSLGDLVLDPTLHTASRASIPLQLLPQEFALLEFLMRNPNRIFNAESLIRRVWHGNSSVDTVRTHIKTLRKKVDTPDLPPVIKTIHGVGYSLSFDH
jgi:DNA-binding response OmpR family regulator